MFNKVWIGTEFGCPQNHLGGAKVLVLGESIHHTDYAPGTVIPDYNTIIMDEYLSRVPAPLARQPYRWLRTFDNVAWALSGKGPKELRIDSGEGDVWRSVAFYNYVSGVVGDSSRKRPTKQQFQDAREDFETALAQIAPEVVVCWGLDLFGWVIHNHYPEYSKPWDFKGNFVDVPRTPIIRVVRMQHPSTAFSPLLWHQVISTAIAQFRKDT